MIKLNYNFDESYLNESFFDNIDNDIYSQDDTLSIMSNNNLIEYILDNIKSDITCYTQYPNELSIDLCDKYIKYSLLAIYLINTLTEEKVEDNKLCGYAVNINDNEENIVIDTTLRRTVYDNVVTITIKKNLLYFDYIWPTLINVVINGTRSMDAVIDINDLAKLYNDTLFVVGALNVRLIYTFASIKRVNIIEYKLENIKDNNKVKLYLDNCKLPKILNEDSNVSYLTHKCDIVAFMYGTSNNYDMDIVLQVADKLKKENKAKCITYTGKDLTTTDKFIEWSIQNNNILYNLKIIYNDKIKKRILQVLIPYLKQHDNYNIKLNVPISNIIKYNPISETLKNESGEYVTVQFIVKVPDIKTKQIILYEVEVNFYASGKVDIIHYKDIQYIAN